MKDMLRAIESRRSRRKYLPTAIILPAVETLKSFIAEFNAKESVQMRLVLDNGDAFKGLKKSYGMFSGVRHYIALVGDPKDPVGIEKLGYYGQWLVLHATALSLGSCWVGGTFDRAACPVELAEGESIICVIVVGNVPQKSGVKENLIYGLTHRKTKTVEQMMESHGLAPEWFMNGMRAAQKAPSAVNRQPVRFTYQEDGGVTAAVEDIEGEGAPLDLGIAKLHFEIGAGGGTWEFGNGAAFQRDEA